MYLTIGRAVLGWLIFRKVRNTVKSTADSVVDFAIMYGESKINNIADAYLLRSYRNLIWSIILYFITFLLILLSHTYEILPSSYIYLISLMYFIILSRWGIGIIRAIKTYLANKYMINKYISEFVWFVAANRSKNPFVALSTAAALSTAVDSRNLSKTQLRNQLLEHRLNVKSDRIVWTMFIGYTFWDLICILFRPFRTYKMAKITYGDATREFFVHVMSHIYHDHTSRWHKWLHKVSGNLNFVMTREELIEKLYKHICKVLKEVFKKKVKQYIAVFILISFSLYITDQFMLRFVINKSKFQIVTEPVVLVFERLFV